VTTTPDERHVPAERYDAALRQLLAAEAAIAGAVARTRAAERDAEEARLLHAASQVEVEAARSAGAAQVALVEEELERLRGELDRLRRELARRSEELARCSSALGSVVASASWRVTRPLRRLTGSTRPEQA
jgi:chromosome segregation ATPase